MQLIMALNKEDDTDLSYRMEFPRKTAYLKVGGELLETTPVFNAYWYFAAERQRIFFRRLSGSNAQYFSQDPIFSAYKFTNSYRASDRVSQYLIRRVIYTDDIPNDVENTFFRIMLFKIFNKIDTWEALEDAFGPITLERYTFDEYDELLSARQRAGMRNYSAAYIMPSAGGRFGHKRKHSNHLKLIEWMMDENYPTRIASAKTMRDGFELLMDAPSLGPFLAYQLITDINYSPITSFSEMEYVVAGPGALDGISKCFVDTKRVSPELIIHEMARQQDRFFAYSSIDFPSLWGRKLQLIDCQNLFCEVSKYSRISHPEIAGISGRTRIKQKFKPIGRPLRPWYPPKWGLNAAIESGSYDVASTGSEIAKAEQLALS